MKLGVIITGALGAAAIFRGAYRPARGVMRSAYVLRCAAEESCDPALRLSAYSGKQPFYSMATGRVISATDHWVLIASSRSPVLLQYGSVEPITQRKVSAGKNVGIGEELGKVSQLSFAVYAVARQPDRTLKVTLAYEPTSWLAAHGLSVAVPKPRASDTWCEQGRRLSIPQAVARCGLEMPSPPNLAILPVSATIRAT